MLGLYKLQKKSFGEEDTRERGGSKMTTALSPVLVRTYNTFILLLRSTWYGTFFFLFFRGESMVIFLLYEESLVFVCTAAVTFAYA